MKYLLTTTAIAALILTGCSKAEQTSGESFESAIVDIPADAAVENAAPEPGILGGNASVPPAAKAPIAIGVPQLAYDYAYGFELRNSSVEALAKHHQALCEKAGPQQCQVLNASTTANPDAGSTRVEITLRVAPQWLGTFKTGLGGDLKSYKARITRQSVTSEDLSLDIVDSEARLKNKTALRDRLQTIIRQSPGKIAELVEAETQLSQVQSDIDSLSSSLATMRQRVATSGLTLTYDDSPTISRRSAFAPLTDALSSVVETVMASLGFLILLIAGALPFALVLVPLGWWMRRLWRKRKAAKLKA
ncbi:DUF4349 domain-containing protein [Asticcacaulis sp. YBE204]|uniref:DUF4349 domain-containing protein n=1 Tax=Asticcacaulis sp. YBE204 TaxID=1282363 RepID=UPI0003C3DC57|nr:DUF4349 domain-containing protein [Asticcacaulis sp. YBE204]ESQ78072.1 hypothetical protein AEYBE204_16385 [Asticcacaulis sp. YBE204]